MAEILAKAVADAHAIGGTVWRPDPMRFAAEPYVPPESWRVLKPGHKRVGCLGCGAAFVTKNTRRNYCSKACELRTLRRRKRKMHSCACLVCARSFKSPYQRAVICSDECRRQFRSRNFNYWKKLKERRSQP